ncbi:hypothetical protein DFH27DRAFT_461932, partial [Peziza echinospora]
CKHDWCLGCLTSRFAAVLTDQALWPPSCCFKGSPFLEMEVIALNLLGQDQYQAFVSKKEEYETKTPLYCPVKTCSAFIPNANKVSPLGTQTSTSSASSNAAVCGVCQTRVCIRCSQVWHPANQECVPDEETLQVKKLAEEEMWASCPDCERIIELSQGCNHMICICKKEFCYVC